MDKKQKADISLIFKNTKNAGNLDYVCCWYKKCSELMLNTAIRTALVSTNSISQGEQVSILWKPLFESGIHIDFAHQTFIWDSEAKIKAHVHCVIIGFSIAPYTKTKKIFVDNRYKEASNINGYLLDAKNMFIESRNTPICQVPEIKMGNQPIDNKQYLFDKNEKDMFVKNEPRAEKYFHLWYGSREFINQTPRYCLWLGNCSPIELRKMPECLKRVEAVRKYRLASNRTATKKLADTPTRFQTENMPTGTYIVIPEVSSQRRKYIPIGFMGSSILCSNKLRILPDATLYHFGILESIMHMSWMRAICGRLKSDYDYSIKIVYNNFPWPDATDAQKAKIEQTAQGILDARALYPDSSLADLYDELTMPPELRKAHRKNDQAVLAAYGIKSGDAAYTSESARVAELMRRYQALTEA